MKRPNRYGGSHAQAPQPTRITAIIIISFFIAAVLIGLLLLICASHKLGGDTGNYNKSLRKAPVESAPLIKPTVTTLQGDDGVDTPSESVVTLPLEEPLEGGREPSQDGQGGSEGIVVTDPNTSAPQQRDRPAIEMMQNAVVEAQVARERRIAVWRINTWLAQRGGPMQGCGEYYVQGQERTGIPASLSAGIAEAESSNGMRTYRHPAGDGDESHNAWGMIGWEYRNGFGCWEEGIAANFDFLMKYHGPGAGKPIPQTIHDCNGYCEGNTTSMTVDWAQSIINTYEPPEGI